MSERIDQAVAQFLGSGNIDWDKLRPVISFVILWNRLEARQNYFIDRDELEKLTRQVALSQGFNIKNYEPFVTFFVERYRQETDVLETLFRTDRREVDVERKIRRLITSDEMTVEETLEAVLLVPYRIRNNLFHGNKCTSELYKQTQLFNNVNEVLFLFHQDLNRRN